MNTYIFLGGAIVAEVIGTIFMKYSEGFTRLWPVCRNCNKLLRCLLSAFPNIGKYTYRYCLRNLVWCRNCTNKPSWLVG